MFGSHVMQQGSLVGPDYLRFDFNHLELPDDETLLEIERRVNERIKEAIDVKIETTTIDEAKRRGAIAEFGEKYDDEVRMVNMDVTLDLCGGTHVENTKEIKQFALASIESKGSGVYRIVGLASDKVNQIHTYLKGFESNLNHLKQKKDNILAQAEALGIDVSFDRYPTVDFIGSYRDVITMRQTLKDYQQAVKTLEKTFDEKRKQQSLSHLEDYLALQDDFGNIVAKTQNVENDALKTMADRLMEHTKQGVIFLANVKDEKVIFVCKSKSDVHAGNLVKAAAQIAGGGGGGRPDFAQAGGKDPSKVDDVIAYVKEQLS